MPGYNKMPFSYIKVPFIRYLWSCIVPVSSLVSSNLLKMNYRDSIAIVCQLLRHYCDSVVASDSHP